MAEDLSNLSPEERAKVLLSRLRPSNGPAPAKMLAIQKPSFDPDLIPQVERPDKSPDDLRLDTILDGIDIVDAYVRLIGKMQPEMRGSRTEGIMISCPMPGHPDTNPSAWINSDKGTWFCGGCQTGGDVYDLAAIHFGYPIPAYKDKDTFPTLRKQLAEVYGYTVIKDNISGREFVVENTPEEKPNLHLVPDAPNEHPQEGQLESQQEPTLAPVVALDDPLGIDDDSLLEESVIIPWNDIIPSETFLYDWMVATTIDDLPHEYYFWLGLMALGFAGGKKNVLLDYQPVKGNLYVCLYGRTGIGKSRSIRPFLKLLEEVFPWQEDPYLDPSGVRLLPTPNSAEAIIDSFHYEVKDSSTQKFDHFGSVTALLRHEELSGLIKKSERAGSSIKEVMIELYDVLEGTVSTHSRTTGVRKAESPFCQMLSTTQPNAIHAFLRKTDVESGFLNRWIMAAGQGRIEPISYGGVQQDLTLPITQLRGVAGWAFAGHNFTLEGQALQIWEEFFKRELADFKAGRVDAESIFSRVDLILKKLIIHFTLNEMKDNPTPEIIERVLSLYPYLRTTYSIFTKDITFNDIADCQQKIVEICQSFEARNKNPSARDFHRYTVRKFDSETISRALKNLVDMGVLDQVPPPPGSRGRPTIKYSYIA